MSTENFTQITLQQLVNLDTTPVTASKYPKYTVNLGFSISNITATELAGAISSAQGSAAAAKASENAAKTSETNAKTSETNAKSSETNAKASETSALASKNAAATSETNAKASETKAKTSETNAKASETAAAASQGAAKTSETNSKASETAAAASQVAAKTSETNAKTSETNAKASETAAFTSKNAAAASESAALASKTSAGISETNAKASETKAKTSETNAKASETASKTSETNAKASELAASDSEDAAALSEANAKASETASKTSETNAKSSETNAKSSADFALVQADRAEEIKNSMPSKEQFMATVKLYDTHQEAVDDLEWRDEGEKVLIWQETAAAYGWYDVEVTNGVKSLVLDRNEKKIKTINNVAPDDLGNVQITLPGGNPSLWLGETVWFPYAPGESIGYSGVLPQDGRLVKRVDYPDAWSAIQQGLVPSVTEAEWQAGARSVFSTGDGSTTFRLPKWDGEVLRAPTSGDEIGKFHDQIPYITKVNGIAPSDATGEIVLPYIASINGATPNANGAITLNFALKGSNSDITGLTSLTAPLQFRNADAVIRAGDASGNTFSTMTFTTSGNLFIPGNINVPGSTTTGALELISPTPFIDFHFNNSTSDYTARFLASDANVIDVLGGSGPISFRVNGGLRVGGAGYPGGINLYRGNGDSTAVWGINCVDGNFTFIRGGSAGTDVNLGGARLINQMGVQTKAGTNGASTGNSFNINWNGVATLYVDSSRIGVFAYDTTSDRQLKKNITYKNDKELALDEVMQWKPATFKMRARGIIPESSLQLGFIANDLQVISPECVSGKGLPEDYDIDKDPNNPDAYSLNQVPMIVKLTQALQAQMDLITALQKKIDELENKSSS